MNNNVKNPQKIAAILMLYRTEMLELLPPDALLLLILSIKKGISDRAPCEKEKIKTPENGLFKPFSGVFLMAGAEGLEPSARGFGGDGKGSKT